MDLTRYAVQSRSSICSRVRWFRHARAMDYVVAAGDSYASIPLVGRHLEPFGALAAVGALGYRHAPEMMSAAWRKRLARETLELRQLERRRTHTQAEEALRGVIPDADLDINWPRAERTAPMWKAAEHRRRHLYRRGVRYGDAPTQVLDVWRRKELPDGPVPVLVFVPGGAWIHGGRILQGYALMSHLAELGWICLSVEYRVAPHHPWPRHIQDVKAAIAWARANVDHVGGDRNFVAIAGTSAGGHLAALAGLTPSDPTFETELTAGADTSVDAVVGIYGRYDWEDQSTPDRKRFIEFLESVVVKRRITRHPDIYRAASPIARVHRDAPPFMVVHGTADGLIPVAQAQEFVEKLRATSTQPVAYLELRGAHHGFDMTDGARTASAATAIGLFLNAIHRDRTVHPVEYAGHARR
ncbi:alpha/beta hydrolase [Mycolicibacterium hodleri]|uniref:Alpha/beta hydrolase n=1 Tax=Mycolicibacterium hodleri TaxID=49897 RepID=A0A502EFT2_9MYCO|nr:alpha/beta hydrolase [Mycolicibacterium hodleri]TPG36583.1 alpha/beta hydrolase [Mycolicibacterium hodleri]